MTEFNPYNPYDANLLPLQDDIMYPPEKVPQGPGCILVIAGPPGGGKDTLMNGVLMDPNLRFQKAITYATRNPRTGEIPSYDYMYRSETELFQMNAAGELAEMAPTGNSYKGTPKGIFEGIYRGEKNIWRIDASRTAVLPAWLQEKYPQQGEYIYSRTKVITVMPSDENVIFERAAKREGNSFNLSQFRDRYEEEMYFIRKYPTMFGTILYNDGTQKELIENGMEMIYPWIDTLKEQEAAQ